MTRPGPASPAWADAALAAALFAVDPAGLRGVVVRGPPGPVREAWLERVRALLAPGAPVRRIPLHVEDDRLLGGLDLAASLAGGRPVAQRGLLAECDGGVAVLPMAERLTDAVAARLAAALDHGEVAVERDGMASRPRTRIGLVALDEGLEPDEQPPPALLERLAFRIDLNGVRMGDPALAEADRRAVARARRRLARVGAPDAAIVEALCGAAQMFGVDSIRAPILALAAARAHAALHGRRAITEADAAAAARLVLGPRATTAPAEASDEEDQTPPPPTDASEPDEAREQADDAKAQTEMVVAAVKAALPEGLFAQASPTAPVRGRNARARGAGAAAKSARRGRPVGSRSGALRAGDRLNLVETLRAAAPWQRLRRDGAGPRREGGGARVLVRRDDFRIRRFVQREESTTIFVVDASGSAAFQRLAEAKGAVELLLAKAYVTRTRVALIAFRDKQAALLLPPTRSLVRAKRRLADLPGGGGTPLASGVDAALALALSERAKTRTPLLVFLTDGRANVARDGQGGRAAAEADALAAARAVQAAEIGAVFLDTSARVQPDGDRFARAMDAAYAPLPYVEARAVLGLVEDRRGARR